MVGRLFGTTGIRGIANEFLTPEFASKISCVFGNYIMKTCDNKRPKIIVGRDTRTSSEMLMYGVISGLLSAGCDVYNSNILPTPAIQYVIRKLKFDGGVIITGSHIPPERNGIKFFIQDSNEVYGEIEKEIEDMYFSERFERAKWNEIGEVKKINGIEVYEEMLLQEGLKVDEKDQLKIVVDTAHGAQSEVIPRVLRKLNHKVITLNAQMDGFFP
ncbi:MAG: phosphoglucosamine mutase, partial [Candidatus Altarchaeaceae archaeon]